jgi:demethylmenaquinone methyltransferase/2-methoxy-6-polyprenyl-1,4-benzoquinol methylase
MVSHPGVDLVHRFFSGTGPSYDYMVNLWTIGFDIWWKKGILEKIPARPRRIIDQACGTGILTFKIARKFPRCRVIGVELREEYLDIAKEKAGALKLNKLEFILGRAEDVLLMESFDCITSSYLGKYAEFKSLIRNAKKMLRDGGILIMHDFTYPPNPAFSRIFEFYFKVIQTVGGWKYPQWKTIFFGLPELLRETEWVAELVSALQENAFSDIHIESLTLGTSTIVTARKQFS